MPHIILLGAINALQGEDIDGSGTLEDLKGCLPAIEALESIPPEGELTEAQQLVMTQAEAIADAFGNGFTPGGLASDTATLGTLIGNL